MCVKLPLGDLNPASYPPHPTSIYTCGVTTAPRVRGGSFALLEKGATTNNNNVGVVARLRLILPSQKKRVKANTLYIYIYIYAIEAVAFPFPHCNIIIK